MKERMVDKKTWQEFRDTGLLLFINQILHAFGWAICVEIEYDNIIDIFPARVKFRGFTEDSVGKSYTKITNFLKENVDELLIESKG